MILWAYLKYSLNNNMVELVQRATSIITGTMVPLAFALCLLYFFWGIAKYIRKDAGGDRAAEEGRRVMMWGLLGIFVVFSIWGIIEFIQKEFQLPQKDTISIQGNSL